METHYQITGCVCTNSEKLLSSHELHGKTKQVCLSVCLSIQQASCRVAACLQSSSSARAVPYTNTYCPMYGSLALEMVNRVVGEQIGRWCWCLWG